MLIGTSLGRCMVSILKGEVDRESVALIITRTRAGDYDAFKGVVKQYYEMGSSTKAGYDFSGFEWEDVEDLGWELWHAGRIHQPRNFGTDGGYLLPEMSTSIWMEVVPTPRTTNESVLTAWENYQTLKALAE